MRERASWPISALYPWTLIVGGTSLVCGRCGAEGRAPLPSASDYNEHAETWLGRHKLCVESSS
jgi:hypothetical protein